MCGDAKHMAKDVHRTMHKIAMECEGWTGNKAEAFMEKMYAEGRYHQDVW